MNNVKGALYVCLHASLTQYRTNVMRPGGVVLFRVTIFTLQEPRSRGSIVFAKQQFYISNFPFQTVEMEHFKCQTFLKIQYKMTRRKFR